MMYHQHDGCGAHGGITAPYCPHPACPPIPPLACMDDCLSQPGCPMEKPGKPPKAEPGYKGKAAAWPCPVKCCPPPHQSGVVCPQPPMKPVKQKCESVLLQKIVCCERRQIPQLCVRLELTELCGCPPYRLMSVQQSGAQPWWKPIENNGPDARRHILVCIPVCCLVCDGEGKNHHVMAVVEAEVSFKACGTHAESWRSSLFIIPCVRLAGGDVCAEEPCFCVQLEVSLEIYLLRPEPCAMQRPEVPCPDMPLYPIPPQWHRSQRPMGR